MYMLRNGYNYICMRVIDLIFNKLPNLGIVNSKHRCNFQINSVTSTDYWMDDTLRD